VSLQPVSDLAPRHRVPRRRRAREVLRTLAEAEIRQARDLTVVGFIKWAAEPLSYMLVYLVLINGIVRHRQPGYPLFLLCALIPFRYFTGVIASSMNVLKRYSSVLTNQTIPRGVLPAVVMIAEGTTFLISLLLLIPFLVFYGIPSWPHLLLLPLPLISLALLTSGPSYLGAVFGLFFPDFRGAVQNLIRVSFFVSSGLLAVDRFSGDLAQVVEANPLTGIFDSFRAIFLEGKAPDATDILYPAAVGILLLAIAGVVYARTQRHFPKHL
jgi:ABC-type polysaccharide/polyol phosphate export permease